MWRHNNQQQKQALWRYVPSKVGSLGNWSVELVGPRMHARVAPVRMGVKGAAPGSKVLSDFK